MVVLSTSGGAARLLTTGTSLTSTMAQLVRYFANPLVPWLATAP